MRPNEHNPISEYAKGFFERKYPSLAGTPLSEEYLRLRTATHFSPAESISQEIEFFIRASYELKTKEEKIVAVEEIRKLSSRLDTLHDIGDPEKLILRRRSITGKAKDRKK